MSSSLFVLHPPTQTGQSWALPYTADLPAPIGRKQPNGTIIVTDDNAPSLLYKFTPWGNSALAFIEIDAYARLRSLDNKSGIVQLAGISATQDYLVRVVERSHKGTLDKFLLAGMKSSGDSLDINLAKSLLLQVAKTMAHMHRLNLVHRDLKAENLLVFDTDADIRNWQSVKAKVSDFDRTIHLADGAFLTEPVGSLFHMAPELLAWEKYDRKVDIYAFGILMYEIVHGGVRAYANVATGMPGSLPRVEFSIKVVNENYRPVWVRKDQQLEELATRCLAMEPEQRPEFHEIVAALQAFGSASSTDRHASTSQDQEADRITGVGIATTIGKRRQTMEDAVSVVKTPDVLIAGVFDGMGGSRTSAFASRQLPVAVAATLKQYPQDFEQAIQTAFESTEAKLRRLEPPITCGTTATIAVLNDHELSVSWLGDSPAYLFRKNEVTGGVSTISLVKPHHPDREDEINRVTGLNGEIRREQKMMDSGEVVPWGPLRVFAPNSGQTAGIALSRALGLGLYKPVIGNEPETIRIARQSDDQYLVVASDGIFEVLTPERAYEIISVAPSAQDAADAIVAAVLANGAPDNASIVVVELKAE